MANLSRDDILKLARLARLSLADEEVELFKKEISSVLDYVEQLQKVDISGLDPTSQVTGLQNVMRPDHIINYGVDPDTLLSNVPVVEERQIKVKRVLG